MELPEIEEIVDAVHHRANELDPTYQEYLERIKNDYLARSQTLDFLVRCGISASANIANAATVLIACELGISWAASASLGLSFGLIPVAYYFNKAGIQIGEEGATVREPGSLLTGLGLLVGGGAVAWNFSGEKRLLIQYADEGRKQTAQIIAEYEVKPQPFNRLFESIGDFIGVSGNWIAIAIVVVIFFKFMRRH